MLSRSTHALAAIAFVIAASLAGCNKEKTPLFIVQTSLLPYGRNDILKETLGRYPYFRNTGWVTGGSSDVIATAKPDVDKVLSGRQQLKSDTHSAYDKYQQYFGTVWYEFLFRVSDDKSVRHNGIKIHEFFDGKDSIVALSPEDQVRILQEIAEKTYPDWMVEAAQKRVVP
jgi:hypothetical protein